MSSTAHGRRFRLPVALMARLELVAAANARTIEAEMELLVDQHVADWEARQRNARGTTAIADHVNNTAAGRRRQAEEAQETFAAELRRRRIENVRRLQNWVEIAEPEERRGGVIHDPATGGDWRPYRGILFNRDQAEPCPHDPIAPRAFFVRDGEVVAFEPFGGRPVPA